jgi:hypothetical protein
VRSHRERRAAAGRRRQSGCRCPGRSSSRSRSVC